MSAKLVAHMACFHLFAALVLTGAEQEFRGLWLATVGNTDWPSTPGSGARVQRVQLSGYLGLLRRLRMNAIMLQVRPMGDALYASPIEPWSYFLTGKQGREPSPFWDPLEYTVSLAHSNGMEVHAWINPYRANIKPTWDGLAPNHMAIQYREFAYKFGDYLWMDPGAEVVQDRIVNVAEDILSRYKVDGIHADDYFYPYPVAGTPFPDNATYAKYRSAGGSLSLEDWRRENVNSLIRRLHNTTQAYRRKLSISPEPFYKPGQPDGQPSSLKGLDAYSGLFADTKLWLQQGWIDMFVPQLYSEIEDKTHSYATLLDWWLAVNVKNTSLCAGIGAYKLSPEERNWTVSELVDQVNLSRDPGARRRGSVGNVLFSGKTLRDNVKSIQQELENNIYKHNATIPPIFRQFNNG